MRPSGYGNCNCEGQSICQPHSRLPTDTLITVSYTPDVLKDSTLCHHSGGTYNMSPGPRSAWAAMNERIISAKLCDRGQAP